MLVAVMSVKGSPGVSTLAVALAARWTTPDTTDTDGPAGGRPPVVVELDPAGGDAAVRFGLRPAPGLASLAAAVRAGPDGRLVWQHAQLLPVGVAVVVAPPDAEQARTAVTAFAEDGGPGVEALRAAADEPGALVVVDAGRVDPGSPVVPVFAVADVMLVLARPRADELSHLVRRLPQLGAWSRCPQLLLAGPGHSFADISREVGVTALRRIPHDPAGAAVLSGHPGSRWWRTRDTPDRSLLGEEAHRLAADLRRLAPPSGAAAAALALRGPAVFEQRAPGSGRVGGSGAVVRRERAWWARGRRAS